MFIDANTVEESSNIDADVCIIGAGAAGISMAKELNGSSLKVCLLESGDFDYDAETQSLYEGKIMGWPNWPLVSSRLRYFGGATNHWGGAVIPLNDDDFETRSWVPDSGWPIRRADLEPYYRRAHPLFQLQRYAFSAEEWETKELTRLPFDEKAIETGVVQHSPPTRFGQTYREEIKNSKNITTFLNANVTNIDTDDSAGEVTGIDVRTLAGNRFRLSSKMYVMALGGVENARLLLLSNKVQKNGLGNNNDLVGRYFADHYYFSHIGVIVLTDPGVSTNFYKKHLYVGESKISTYLALSKKLRHKEKLLTTRVYFGPLPWEKYSVVQGKKKDDSFSAKIARLVNRLSGEKRIRSNNPQDYGERSDARAFRVGAWSETVPRPDSRVMLGSELDKLGQRKTILDWRIKEEEKQSLIRSLNMMAVEIGKSGLGRMRVDLDSDSSWPWSGGGVPGLHHMGTTRMHADPKKGVVDENCRVHGISNLYIGGSSVFPNYGIANPTFTIVALALRLNDHLKREWKK